MTGRDKAPVSNDGVPATSLWRFHRLQSASTAAARFTRVATGPLASHYFAIDEAGALFAWGRNDRGQLGLGHLNNVYAPTRVPGVPPVASVACGRSHSLAVALADGAVFAAGCNKRGQCSVGLPSENPLLKFQRCALMGGKEAGGLFAVSVACGNEFSVAADLKGRLLTCGSQQFGQCGTGVTGEYIVSAGKVDWTNVDKFLAIERGAAPGAPGHQANPRANLGFTASRFVSVAAGACHAVGLTSDGLCWTWGFGGFGRLGHGVPADELVPRQVKVFEADRLKVRQVTCGSSSTFYTTHMGSIVYMSGITKKTGEANMIPKYEAPLQGFKVRVVASGNTSTLVAADTSLIAWGASPTYGELGFGEETKSSTKHKLVDDLEGILTIDVASGLGATIALIDTFSSTPAAEKARKLIAEGKLPAYVPPEPKAAGGAGAAGGGAGGKRPAEEEAPVAGGKGKKAKAK
jgi:alpha-tubulin suppressor-like RCC1 family protein